MSDKNSDVLVIEQDKLIANNPFGEFNIELSLQQLGGDGSLKPTISSKDVHALLGVKTRYADWIVRRITEYGFVENQDFILIFLKNEHLKNPQGRTNKEYFCTIDMAKMLCMVDKTERAHDVRRYFLDIEKLYIESHVKKLAISDLMLQLPREWVKTFPNEFFELVIEMYEKRKYDHSKNKPSYVGAFINKYVYDFLDPNIVNIAKQNRIHSEKMYTFIHSYLDEHYGLKALQKQIDLVINTIMLSNCDIVLFKVLIENYKNNLNKKLLK